MNAGKSKWIAWLQSGGGEPVRRIECATVERARELANHLNHRYHAGEMGLTVFARRGSVYAVDEGLVSRTMDWEVGAR